MRIPCASPAQPTFFRAGFLDAPDSSDTLQRQERERLQTARHLRGCSHAAHGKLMTYCLGIRTKHGLVMASDSRTNAGIDQVDICCKMHNFVVPGERMFTLLSSGSLSLTQSIMTRIEQEFAAGQGLVRVGNFYDAARCVGRHVREVAELDRPFMERDNVACAVNFLLGGQIRGEDPQVYMIYSQGNPLRCTRSSPFLQIGESKYGRPILDRGIRYEDTSLEQAVKYAVISLDSTMRSNVAVGPPIDLLVYANDEFDVRRYRRLGPADAELIEIRTRWERELRQAIGTLPEIGFQPPGGDRELGITHTVNSR
jgi:putative proteasome-type protease